MYKIKFYFKINIKKNKKNTNYNNIGSLLLLSFIFKKSNLKLQKIFTNKYMMLKAPFHYKVSKKLLYNKQAILIYTIFFKKNFNYFFFKNFNYFNSNGHNIFKIKIQNFLN